ncbi:MAG: HisS family protein, partial [Chloroflexi bacterium]|nr:HisS family protein [Chloroflexota bacterium]
MNIPRCKGTRDLLPEDMVKFRYIEDIFRQSCKQWGYEEVRTPVIEYLHLFTSAGTLTPEMLNRVYSFLDWDGWSGERVVLRPDGTIPIARLFGEIAQQQETKKLSYVENVFAFEGTGKDSREQWECGVELLGRTGVDGDVELITFAVEILKKLGISPEVRLSHAGLMKALINELGSQTLLEQVLNGKHEVVDTLKKKNPELSNQLATLFSLSGTSKGFLENLRAIFPSLAPNFDELTKVTELLDTLNCPFVVHLTSGMSFEYYTGTIFQFYHSEEKIGGGGRYDELIPLVGDGPVPASGFALYLDRIMNLLKYENQETKFH